MKHTINKYITTDVDVEIDEDDVIEFIEQTDNKIVLDKIADALCDRDLNISPTNSPLILTLDEDYKMNAFLQIWDKYTSVEIEEMISDYIAKTK